jgi:DNA-binding transcriptional LysR family regulator
MRPLMSCMLAAGLALTGSAAPPQIRDVDGRARDPFKPAGRASVLVFVTSDCPISNAYAPEIQRLCAAYADRGVECALIYEDAGLPAGAVRRHLAEYRYANVVAILDDDRAIAQRAGASVTPQAVVVDAAGRVRYRGRIDDFYAALGRPRRHVTSHDLRDALDAVLAGHAVARPETEALGCYIAPVRKQP